MKVFFPLAQLLASAVHLSSCADKSKKYYISMRLAKGDTFYMKSLSKSNLEIEIMGVKQQINMTSDSEARFEVTDSSDSGSILKMTFTRQNSDMQFGKGFPSASPKSRMDSLSKTVLGKSVFLTIKNNEVSNVRGWDSVMPVQDSAAAEISKKLMPAESLTQLSEMAA